MSSNFKTERISLRYPAMSDLDDFAEMNADSQIMQFIGSGVPYSLEKSSDTLTMLIDHWKTHGFGLWMLRNRQSESFIGFAVFNYPEGQDGIELGWRLRSECWGKGYAFEAANFALNYAKENFDEYRLIHRIQTENKRSINLALKLGSQFLRYEKDGDRDVAVYETIL